MNFNRGTKPKDSMGIGRGEYSREQFDGYRYRAIVFIQFIENGAKGDIRFDVYTTETDREKAEYESQSRRKDHVTSLQIIHWASKEQDDAAAELIEETLKDL